MKRRVRGLLHRKWLGPLGALALAVLPIVITLVLVGLLVVSTRSEAPSIIAQITDLFDRAQDPKLAIATLVVSFELDYTQLISMLPGLAVFAGVFLFVGMPVGVSVSGYFLSFLRGKGPRTREVFSCFSDRYPRILAGMLYMLLWVLLWAAMAFVAPLGIYSLGNYLTTQVFVEQLSMNQIWVYGVQIGFCLLWFVVFTMVFVNRVLAYSLTPVCISAQPRLPAYRAVRLSRKLMRGCKWQLIGLRMSFLNYYVPTIVAGLLLVTLKFAGPALSVTEIMQKYISLCLWVVIGVNQLVIVYVAPYMAACVRAFYIERKREALMDEEVTADDFAPKRREEYRVQVEIVDKRAKKTNDQKDETDSWKDSAEFDPAVIKDENAEQ